MLIGPGVTAFGFRVSVIRALETTGHTLSEKFSLATSSGESNRATVKPKRLD